MCVVGNPALSTCTSKFISVDRRASHHDHVADGRFLRYKETEKEYLALWKRFFAVTREKS